MIQLPFMSQRQCIYCGTPIYESMGYVLPRDVLLLLEGKWDFATMGWPHELCHKDSCNEKWKEELEKENETPTDCW
jgi:hypothetical protein